MEKISYYNRHINEGFDIKGRRLIFTDAHQKVLDTSFDGQPTISVIPVDNMISPEEINARLAELKSVLDIISSKPALANAMFYERVMSKPVMSPPLALDMSPDYIYESDLLRNVGRNSLLRSISRIDIYKKRY